MCVAPSHQNLVTFHSLPSFHWFSTKTTQGPGNIQGKNIKLLLREKHTVLFFRQTVSWYQACALAQLGRSTASAVGTDFVSGVH